MNDISKGMLIVLVILYKVKVNTVERVIGSWIINYEKVDNAVIAEDTVTHSANNQSDDDLYMTFKQNVGKLDYFAKFKLLFYKADKIVDTEDGYFITFAENLNGNDSTHAA